MENENLGNNKPNLKDKIKNSQIYQIFIQRALFSGNLRSLASVFLYVAILFILDDFFSTITTPAPKPESELYRTDGNVLKISDVTNRFFNFRGSTNPKIKILTDNNKTITFEYIPDGIKENRAKITNKYLKNKRITIYSNILPNSDNIIIAEKIIGENGEVLSKYEYEWQQSVRERTLSYKRLLFCVFLLILIYFINKNNLKINSNKNQNLSQTKE